MAANRSFEGLDDAVRNIIGCDESACVPSELARIFAERFTLWRISLIRMLPDRVIEVATWTVAGTVLGPGTEVPLSITEDAAAHGRELQRGRGVLFKLTEVDLGLAGDVLAGEGARQMLVVPLRGGDTVVAVINLVSARDDAFSRTDLPLFEGIARGVEAHIVSLLGHRLG